MNKTFAILVLFLFTNLSACNLPGKSTSAIPKGFVFGTWNCMYMENGMYAGGLPVTLNQDGTAEFKSVSGKWTFDSPTNTFTFSPEIALQNAVYYPENGMLGLTLLPGQTIGGHNGLSCVAPNT